MYCHVSAQIDRHQAIIDKETELEEAVEKHAIEIFDQMLEGCSDIDEDVAQWADENGVIFDVLKTALSDEGTREERKENLMKLLEEYSDTINEIAMEKASEELE